MSPWSKISRSFHDRKPGHWPGITEQIPVEFREAIEEPAFLWEATTFCIWRTYEDARWCVGTIDFPKYDYWQRPDGVLEVGSVGDPDGSNFLLSILDGKPESFKEFADGYFAQEDGASKEHSLQAIRHVYQHLPLTNDIVRQLNPKVGLKQLAEEIYETIGYPAEGRIA